MRFLTLLLLYIGSIALAWAGEAAPTHRLSFANQQTQPASIASPISPIEPHYKKPIKSKWWKKLRAKTARQRDEISEYWYLGMFLVGILAFLPFGVVILSFIIAAEEALWILSSLLLLLFIIYNALLLQTFFGWWSAEGNDEFINLLRVIFGYLSVVCVWAVFMLLFWATDFSISWATSDNVFYAVTAIYTLIFSAPWIFFALFDHIKTY